MTSVDERKGEISHRLTKPFGEVMRGYTPFRDGDVLFAKITPCMENGKAAIARDLQRGIGYGSTEFHVLRPRNSLLAEWLLFILRNPAFRQYATSSFQGAVGQQRVPESFLRRFKIPLPPISEQKKIIEVLGDAEWIRAAESEIESLTARLIPSVFADIFGELHAERASFPTQALSSIGELDRGKSKHRPRDEPSLYGGPYPFIQTGDVAQSNGWITSFSQTYSEKGLAQSRLWPKGTLVITIAANIGATGILAFDACFPDSMVGFTPGQGISVEYVRWWLLGYQKKLEAQAPQGAQKNINLKTLRAIRIPVPPVDLQQRFREQVQNIRGQLELMSKATRSAAMLTESLTANALSGTLTAEWREAHTAQLEQEARERDASLEASGAKLARAPEAPDIEPILPRRTDGAYAELTREQHAIFEGAQHVLEELKRRSKSGRMPCWFTAEHVAKHLGGPWRKHVHTIESALGVLAARGLIIPVSREDAEPITGEIYYGTAYRLPQASYENPVQDVGEGAEETGPKNVIEAFITDGDKARQSELKRLSELTRKGRPE